MHIGDTLELYLDHPVETFANINIYTDLQKTNGDYLIVSAVAPNELGDRDYVLYKKILKLP